MIEEQIPNSRCRKLMESAIELGYARNQWCKT